MSPGVDQIGVEERVDTTGKVRQLCAKAQRLHTSLPGLPHVAAVCVYPPMITVAKQSLHGSGIKTASVATAFPSGQTSMNLKIQETEIAVDAGAGI